MDRVMEVHGTFEKMQCTQGCGSGLLPADGLQVTIDESTMRTREPLPTCPHCQSLIRPNILMFNDWEWDGSRTEEQESRLRAWLRDVGSAPLVIVECGAGTAVPTVRYFCEQVADHAQRKLIRINVREPHVPKGHISLAVGALEGLRAIDEYLAKKSG